MSIPQKLIKVIQNLYSQIVKQIRSLIKRGMAGVLRNLVGMGHRARTSEGFILPTVTMVILVVLLLTTAIVFRSFDRSRNASNVRVNQALLNAAAPAMERASIKLDTLFDDPRLPRSTPSDPALYDILASDNDKYTFEGEERLKLAFDLNEDNSITQEGTAGRLEQWETLSTAWRFPVDTDGNGIFDSFTLYGIYFRSPDRNTQGEFTTGRTPLDVRTPPQDEGIGSGFCAAALSTSAKLVTQAGWYKSGSKLKKSFIVYTATVPITDINELGLDQDKYENSTGNKGISVLEYQQDRARIPLSNNAVVFEDDLTIVAGENFYLNGRVMTNSNIFAAPARSGVEHKLYQVSSPKSCFYDQENSKILVGGNILNSLPLQDSVTGPAVPVDLFVADANPNEEDLTSTNQSTASSEKPQEIVYNSKAYTDRINFLVNSWIGDHALPNQPNTGEGVPNTDDPDDVQTQVKANQASEAEAVRFKALTNWFKDRTRRVPFKEVAFDPTGTPPSFTNADKPKGTRNELRPPKEWMFPVDPSDGKTATNYAEVSLNISGDEVEPPATEPETQRKENKELFIGDRALVGNNLPAKWYQLDDYATYNNNDDGIFVADEGQPIVDTLWDEDDSNPPQTRQRFTSVRSLGDVGDKGRDGFWEKAAATAPKNILEGVGGLRVVTGAGIYERKNSFLPPPVYQNPTTGTTSATYDDPTTGGVVETFPVVWPDTMPMSPGLVLPASFSDELNPWVYNNKPGVEGWIRLTSATDRSNADTAAKTIDRNTPRYTKGDLRMRATAVYHYADDIYQDPNEGTDQAQAPIACVSSYYDPSYYLDKNGTIFDSTKNLDGLPDNSDPNGKSNNGISYSPPSPTSAGVGQLSLDATTNQLPGTDAAITLNGKLAHQGNLVFPNGRFVNPLLRQALQKPHNQRSLSEQSAIDSTICAIQILDGTLSPDATVIPHGAIKEVAFLDARQVQRLDEDDPATPEIEPFEQGTQASNYDLSLAQRQPLEIRATQIDLDTLRNKTISVDGSIVPAPPPDGNEYLLPNSGIIYATRDDAQPDLSAPPNTTLSSEQRKATQLSESKVDYRLDPTRRPNGIMLINGESLARGNSQDFREVEKGLILATDLPAYVYKDFNLHTEQEFDQTLADNWGNFYSRSTPNENFACRPNDDRLPDCTTGDEWRAATVISDAITLLSNNFRFGYRNEGDYDLRNNQGWAAASARRENGFFDNNYVTNGLSSKNLAFGASRNFTDANYTAAPAEVTDRDSSYFNNFVTPVQRRGEFREYVMEICRKLPVSECQPADWVIGLDDNADATDGIATPDLKASAPDADLIGADVGNLVAGTTASPPLLPEDQRYARRVAFRRQGDGSLALNAGNPIPLGINNAGKVAAFASGVPRSAQNALWFRTINSGTVNYNTNSPLAVYGYNTSQGKIGAFSITTLHPLLVPVLQVNVSQGYTFFGTANKGNKVESTNWQPRASETRFNLIAAAGNTPMRTNEADGGLPNFPRFLENWNAVNARISGSLLEFDRSAYATGPFRHLLSTSGTGNLFNYPLLYNSSNDSGLVVSYTPPNRQLGYDVGLLSQLPDLFAARFTTPPSGPPDVFYREVSRNDEWIKTLLCGRVWNSTYKSGDTAINNDQRPTAYCKDTTDE
ncbi:hormogonium polysaccharide biosynthesis protein HpsA [Coleofasciculus chthonoplastes]|uniref:hormogonium polysaccharide biosynthesis protein HpsA n=1 Tax=Coleofasciculus chthonoplastes TaxID=64178 RepID=UPI0032FF97DB